MGWPYEFILKVSDEEKVQRRQALDHFASLAHWSAFAPIPIFLVFSVVQRVVSKRITDGGNGRSGRYQRVPGSPLAKARQMTASGELATRWRKLRWWLEDEVYLLGESRGQKGDWLFGAAWFMWLLSLCVIGTGNDYLHLTKKFGLIAVSQIPAQYLLSLKAMNPFAYVFRSSHEQVNRYHRILGRLIYGLLALHIAFYNFFFIEMGIWLKRYLQPIVFAGAVAAIGINVLFATALPQVRAYSYRLFFIVHLVVAFGIPPLIFIHAPSARIYLAEAFIILLLDLATRKLRTVHATSRLETIPGTSLFKVTIPIPAAKMDKFKALPASHVYLNIPAGSRPAPKSSGPSVFDFTYNPFTVAAVNSEDNEITLVARKQAGPFTTYLHKVASQQPGHNELSLAVETPRGAASKHFNELSSNDISRVLLVAGGIGATFAVSMYRSLLHENPDAQVQLVWALRAAGDATWTSDISKPGEKSLMEDDRVQLFLTGDMSVAGDPEGPGDGVELSTLRTGANEQRQRGRRSNERRRPDLQKFVDDAFKKGQGETVAVLVCGPSDMAREVRKHVTPWVMTRNRKVWYHEESFGF